MAQFSAGALVQDVAVNQNVLFTNTNACCCGNGPIIWNSGSGIITLRGGKNQRARYAVSFNGNVATPTGTTASQLSFAITKNGEPLSNAIMSTYPPAVTDLMHISSNVEVDVPCGCCYTLAVRNVGTETTEISNVNLVVTRTC